MDFQKILERYNYDLPEKFIAQKPASPRDSAKLLVYEKQTGEISYDTFTNIGDYLPKGAVLVFNETKVVPARLELKKETGGKVKILYTKTIGNLIEVMADRKLETDSKLFLSPKIFFTIKKQEGKYYYLKPSFSIKQLFGILKKYGKTPIPPYIKHSPLKEADLKEKYQAVFAQKEGSIAAPTASLHFTKRLFDKFKKQGFQIKFITLHVGLGTFAPLTEENFETSKLHQEHFEIDFKTARVLNEAKKAGSLIIGVGTTVVRALESAADSKSKLAKLSGATDLFIQEDYRFKFVDGIITNFHVPKSSLLMLTSAFIGRGKLFELYKKAKNKNFKFFSFGDGMIIY